MSVDISVLGGTSVRVDGAEQDLGGRRPAEVLALLVAADGGLLDADVLADRLWRGDPPRSARTTLQGYVARLRRLLDPGLPAREARLLKSRGTGYRLDVPEEWVDVRRFASRCAAADAARRRSDPHTARHELEEALAGWAEPYPDLTDVVDLAPVLSRLGEQHLNAVESLAEVRLELGDDAEAVAGLASVAAEHPLREGMQLLLARALYRCHRQAEALDVLRLTRECLTDELGLDPSAQLRDLEAAILRQDCSLAPTEAALSPHPNQGLSATPADPVTFRPFVGRDGALADLDAAWSRASTGHATVAVVTGEPGIGKTTLVEVFLRRHPDAEVRRARCPATSGAPPYWLWQQVFGGLPATHSDAGARFALAVDLARQLVAAASARPLVVTVDDLQWADEDSLHVLEVVLDQLGAASVLVVLGVRDEGLTSPAVNAVLARAARLPGSLRVPLRGLTATEVEDLVGLLGGAWTPDGVADLVHRSGGNPFFVTELAARGPGESSLPAGVRDVLRLRLAGLSAPGRALAETVALAGGDLGAGFAGRVLGLAPEGLDDGVGDAVRHGVLVRDPADRLAFTHDLQREVLLESLGPGRRSALHAALADALAAGPAARTATAAIAVHRSEAARGATSPDAAASCLCAAAEAFERAGYAEARDLARRGLEHAPMGSENEIDLHQLLGRALRRLGLLEEGHSHLVTAFGLARDRDDLSRMGVAALSASGAGIGGYWGSMAAIVSTDEAMLGEAVAVADRMPAPLGASLLAALAVQHGATGRAALTLAQRALAAAGDDRQARARALVAEYVALWSPAHAKHRLRLARRMIDEAAGDAVVEATALHLYRTALLECDRPVESAAASRRFTELVTRRGDGDQLLLDRWWDVGLALARGDFDRARSIADAAVDAAPTVSPAAGQLVRISRQTVEGIIAWHERRLTDEVPEVVDLATTLDDDWLGVLAQAYAQAGRRDEALAVAERLLERPRAASREPVRTVILADVAIELGDRELAEQLLPVLETYGDTIVVFWVGVTFLGPVSLYRGGVKAVLGRPDAAEDLTKAVETSERHGFRPFAERARRLLGGLTAQRRVEESRSQRG